MMNQGGVKERIMSTACRLFYEQGYQATGINQIIEEAGIAKSSLYQHFASKELLLNEYLITRKTEWMDGLILSTESLPDGREKLLAFLDYRMHNIEKYNFKGCTFSRVIYELPNLSETSAEIIRKHKSAIKTFIQLQLQAIKDPYAEVEEMADMIFNLSEGSIIQATLSNSSKPLLDTRKSVGKLLAGI